MVERKEKVLFNLSKINEEHQRTLFSRTNRTGFEIVLAKMKLEAFLDLLDEELLTNGLDEGQLRIMDRVFTGVYHYRRAKEGE